MRKTQEEQLAYYTIRAPFDGVVGDIPVHVGDFASPLNSPQTVLTTVDENKDLEAYIYVPTERSGQVRQGLSVDLMDNAGKLLEKTRIDFLSAEVDSTLQGILVKAPVHATPVIASQRADGEGARHRLLWMPARAMHFVTPVPHVLLALVPSQRLSPNGSRRATRSSRRRPGTGPIPPLFC